jgi:hypothetical protein
VILSNDRITITTLNIDVINLSRAAKQYAGIVTLTAVQETEQTLTWLVRFQINDELASQPGITVSTARMQAALAEIRAAANVSGGKLPRIDLYPGGGER